MAVHQCPHCELRFRSEAEYNDHLRIEHGVDPARLEPFHYGAAREQKPLYPDLVEGVDDKRHQVLVVSNATLRAERLHDHLAEQAKKPDTLFLLVVPAEETGRVLQHEQSFATIGRPVPAHEQTTSGTVLAQHRLNEALSRLRAEGLAIEGMVGDADPLRSVADALPGFKADEIVVSTLPQRLSRWLAADLPTELRRRFGIPVTVVTAG
jgi:GABA permease